MSAEEIEKLERDFSQLTPRERAAIARAIIEGASSTCEEERKRLCELLQLVEQDLLIELLHTYRDKKVAVLDRSGPVGFFVELKEKSAETEAGSRGFYVRNGLFLAKARNTAYATAAYNSASKMKNIQWNVHLTGTTEPNPSL